MIPLIYNFSHPSPFVAFFVDALFIAIIVAAGFALNEYLSEKFKEQNLQIRVGKKIGIHFAQSLIISFLVVSLFYIFFGLGTSKFPLCSYLQHCNLKKLGK